MNLVHVFTIEIMAMELRNQPSTQSVAKLIAVFTLIEAGLGG